jgi:hypothetical protein
MNEREAQRVVEGVWQRMVVRPEVYDPEKHPHRPARWRHFRAVSPDGSALPTLLAGALTCMTTALGPDARPLLLAPPWAAILACWPYMKIGETPARIAPPFHALVEEFQEGADVAGKIPLVHRYMVVVVAGDTSRP